MATGQDWHNKVSLITVTVRESQHPTIAQWYTSTTETSDSKNHFIYIITQQVNLSTMLGAAQLNKITTRQGIPSVITTLLFNSTKLSTDTTSLHTMSDNWRKVNTASVNCGQHRSAAFMMCSLNKRNECWLHTWKGRELVTQTGIAWKAQQDNDDDKDNDIPVLSWTMRQKWQLRRQLLTSNDDPV